METYKFKTKQFIMKLESSVNISYLDKNNFIKIK